MAKQTSSPIEDARDFIARIMEDGSGGTESYIDWIWSRRDAMHVERVRQMRERFGLAPAIAPALAQLHLATPPEAADRQPLPHYRELANVRKLAVK